eukprot:XP_001193995.2 PREDICTED: ankycorbin-like [Strongylocentrotus purpuratus]
MADINQQLREAASGGKIKSVIKCLDKGSNINQTEQDGDTPLNLAVLYGHENVIEYLIDHGAKLDQDDGDTSTIEKLVSGGADLNIQSPDGQTSPREAITLCNNSEKLLQETDTLRKLDQNDLPDIHLAIQDGDTSTIQILVSEGADLHIQSPDGHEAIALCNNSEKLVQETDTLRKLDQDDGDTSTIEKLVSGGADLNIQSPDGQTSPREAITLCNNSEKILQETDTLRKLDQNDLTDIHLAIQDGHTSTIEKLVSEGADLNTQSPGGQTCLHEAIQPCTNSDKVVQETDTLRKVSDSNETDTRPTPD